MAAANLVVLIGNLTRDVELRTAAGQSVTDLGLAVNDKRKNTSGEWVDDTTFVDVAVWGKTADFAHDNLRKGSPVYIEGRLKLETWEKDGKRNSKLKVVCNRLQSLVPRDAKPAEDKRKMPAFTATDDADVPF